ncbi:BTAD domain-containing putative transcriptional regulator [Streptomyces sp. NPDC059008]|uniref:AfsR/SARP family transcriptional regulator n=1 Tax=Streptomyces sp. NPDC059008 TaxID=3346693 RepID=UPI00369301C1
MLSFRILGPIEIISPLGAVRLKGVLQRTLLASLLINVGKLVPTESLIDELWADSPPDGVENALHAHVSRLRRRLASLEPETQATRLITHPSGYRLIAELGELDVSTFMAGTERLRNQLSSASSPAGAVSAATVQEIRRLLALWRGPACGGFLRGARSQAAAALYQETRLGALEMLFDCELELGQHRQIIPELNELLMSHPYKERFRQQLMVALYRSGRQAEALDVYRALRHQLSHDLGLKPSPTMREYERAVLEQDPVLNVVDPATRGVPLSPPLQHQAY